MNPIKLFTSRSQSMPSLKPLVVVQPIHKTKLPKPQGKQARQKDKPDKLPVISLYSLSNIEEDQLNNKLKILAERNAKKLEEKYDTIDRWKQRYISDTGTLAVKYKTNLDESLPLVEEKQNPENQEMNVGNSLPGKGTKLLPIVAKQPFSAVIPDHREQSRRLEAELIAKLQKNKRYYEVKNSEVRKQVNYFAQAGKAGQTGQTVPADKKREVDLNKGLTSAESKKGSLLHIFHKNFSSKDIYPEINSIQTELSKKYPRPIQIEENLFENRSQKINLRMAKAKNIYEFKESLLELAVEEIPGGWDMQNEFHSHSHEFEHSFQ